MPMLLAGKNGKELWEMVIDVTLSIAFVMMGNFITIFRIKKK